MAHPKRPVVLVAGGGVAALEAVLALRVLAGPALELELLAPGEDFVYRPGAVMVPFGRGEARRVPLATLAEDQSLTLRHGALAEVDAGARTVLADTDEELAYDVLLVALGATPEPVVPGALTFAGPADALALRQALDDLRRGDARSIAFALPVGASWPLPLYELALMTQAALAADRVTGVEITIATPEETRCACSARLPPPTSPSCWSAAGSRCGRSHIRPRWSMAGCCSRAAAASPPTGRWRCRGLPAPRFAGSRPTPTASCRPTSPGAYAASRPSTRPATARASR